MNFGRAGAGFARSAFRGAAQNGFKTGSFFGQQAPKAGFSQSGQNFFRQQTKPKVSTYSDVKFASAVFGIPQNKLFQDFCANRLAQHQIMSVAKVNSGSQQTRPNAPENKSSEGFPINAASVLTLEELMGLLADDDEGGVLTRTTVLIR